jgi:hypothetical protein
VITALVTDKQSVHKRFFSHGGEVGQSVEALEMHHQHYWVG